MLVLIGIWGICVYASVERWNTDRADETRIKTDFENARRPGGHKGLLARGSASCG